MQFFPFMCFNSVLAWRWPFVVETCCKNKYYKNIAVSTVLYSFINWLNISVWKFWLPASQQFLYHTKFLYWNTDKLSSKALFKFLQRKLNFVYFHFFCLLPECVCQHWLNITDGMCFIERRGPYDFVRASAQHTSDMRTSERASQNLKRFFDTNTCFWPLAFLCRGEGG
jgi:hypothetical protein